MAAVTLEILQKSFRWDLPKGADSITVDGLKTHIGEKGKVLYHQKLSFASGGKALESGDKVPLSPSVVQVKGPASVVHMLSLFCERGQQPVERPKPKAPAPAPRPVLQDRTSQIARGYEDARRFDFGGRGSPFAQSLQGGFHPQANPMGFNAAPGAGRNPPPSSPRQGAPGYSNYEEAVMKDWLSSLNDRQQLSEEQDFSQALLASQASVEADEEAQLRWALEESARLAELENARSVEQQSAEDIKKFYMQDMESRQHAHKSKASSSTSTTAAASAQAALVESEDEGLAWDSDSEGGARQARAVLPASEEEEDSDDEGPPPLELIPNSEE